MPLTRLLERIILKIMEIEIEEAKIREPKKTISSIQRKAAKIWIDSMENEEKITGKEMARKAGAGIMYQENPKRIFDSRGFKLATAEILKELKFDKESKLQLLAEIANERTANGTLKDKKAVIAAIAEGNKMLGDYAPTKQQNEDIITQRQILIKPE